MQDSNLYRISISIECSGAPLLTSSSHVITGHDFYQKVVDLFAYFTGVNLDITNSCNLNKEKYGKKKK